MRFNQIILSIVLNFFSKVKPCKPKSKSRFIRERPFAILLFTKSAAPGQLSPVPLVGALLKGSFFKK